MKLALIKNETFGLSPVYNKDRENYHKLRDGEIYVFTVRRDRNLRHHRKFFAILQTIVNNSEKWGSAEELLMALKKKLGYWKVINGFDDEQFMAPGSINFEKCDQDLFSKFYDAALPVLARELECTVEELESMSIEEL